MSFIKLEIPMKTNFIYFLACMTIGSLANASVLGVTELTISPSTDPVNDTAILQNFTNASGTFTLTGTTDVSKLSTLSSSDSFRNFWGSAGSEINGSASLEGLNLGHGVVNLVQVDFQFGVLIGDGDTTNGNDIVLFEMGDLDEGTTVLPLDISGDVIGDFAVAFGSGSWGDTGTGILFT